MSKPTFDPQEFLAKVGTGKTISTYRTIRFVARRSGRHSFLYSERQGQGLSSSPNKAKKLCLGFWRRGNSLVRVVLTVMPCASQRQRRWKSV
jgi:hypothetical protein